MINVKQNVELGLVTPVRSIVDPMTADRISVTDHPTFTPGSYSSALLAITTRVPRIIGLFHTHPRWTLLHCRSQSPGLSVSPFVLIKINIRYVMNMISSLSYLSYLKSHFEIWYVICDILSDRWYLISNHLSYFQQFWL